MKKVTLIVGHSAHEQGAKNVNIGVSEFTFNSSLAVILGDLLAENSYICNIVYRDAGYAFLPQKVNQTNADIAVSLHCNAFNKEANGSETLYYKGSKKGELLAGFIQHEVVKCLDLKDRGLKICEYGHVGKAGDRGGYLLKKTKMPCVIVEPFFIDSDSSLNLAQSKIEELAKAYFDGIEEYFGWH